MHVPALPDNEPERLATLRGLEVLDSLPEERFDRITRLAKRLFDVPIALVSLVDDDRQWFKSRIGLDASETPRDVSFCGHAILGSDVFVVRDACADERFSDNPLVTGDPNVRFYAGCPLELGDGARVGTLCVIDQHARAFEDEDFEILRDLARMVEQELAALQLVSTDELTGLANRRGFTALAMQTLAICRRRNQAATLLYFDLDGFKGINDQLGHAEGDRALQQFADSLTVTLRGSDVVARLGGDEFAALLSHADADGAGAALLRLEEHVDAVNRDRPPAHPIVYSVGTVTHVAGDGWEGIDVLLAAADAEMYRDKRSRGADRTATDSADTDAADTLSNAAD